MKYCFSSDFDLFFLLFKQNQTNEKSQRYGSTSVPGTGRIDHVDFKSIQEKVKTADNTVKQTYQNTNPNRGYGGKYGTDQVMDKVNDGFLLLLFRSLMFPNSSLQQISHTELKYQNIPRKQVRRNSLSTFQ